MTTRAPAKRKAAPLATPGEVTSELLVGRMAAKYGVPATTLLGTLRDTVFKPGKNEAPFSDHELAAALVLADKYDLNPFAKEIYVTRSHGKLLVIVAVDGWIKLTNSKPSYDGCEFEFESDSDGGPVSCTCRIFDKQRGRPIEVTEFFDECFRPTDPWKQWPRRMLRHKTFIQCARLAYGFAGIVDEDEAARVREPEYRVVDAREVTPAPAVAPPVIEPAEVGDVEPEDDGRAALWVEWLEVSGQLTAGQLTEVLRAIDVKVVGPKTDISALDQAVGLATEIVQGGRE